MFREFHDEVIDNVCEDIFERSKYLKKISSERMQQYTL